jgi:hypothetical protein
MWKENKLTNDEIIGTNGGHEFYHVLNDLDKKLTPEQHGNAKAVEKEVAKQFGEKKKK